MQILVSSDDRICCDAELIRRIEGVVEGMLEQFTGQVTRIEVRLSDLNSSQMGDRDKRCLLEARIAGLQPVATTHEAATLTEAIHYAAEQLRRALGEHLRKAESKPAREMETLPILKP